MTMPIPPKASVHVGTDQGAAADAVMENQGAVRLLEESGIRATFLFIGHPTGKKGFQAKILGLEALQRDGIADTAQLDQFDIFQVFGGRRHQLPDHGARFGDRRTQKNNSVRVLTRSNNCGMI